VHNKIPYLHGPAVESDLVQTSITRTGGRSFENGSELDLNHQTRRTSGRNVDDCQFRALHNQRG